MGISSMKETQEERLDKLYNEFWDRMHAIADRPHKSGMLDGGKSPEQELLLWYKAEAKKIRAEYSEE